MWYISPFVYLTVPSLYADSIFDKVSIRDEDDDEYIRGELHYAPKYIYYFWDG